MVPEVDLDSWSFKTVPITTSAELENLDKNAQYAIMVAARSKAVSAAVPHPYSSGVQLREEQLGGGGQVG